ncbi:Dynein heavy chain [Phytophthora cactorum]|nr:Dynein heavy chain [Phytophthora cactorum]
MTDHGDESSGIVDVYARRPQISSETPPRARTKHQSQSYTCLRRNHVRYLREKRPRFAGSDAARRLRPAHREPAQPADVARDGHDVHNQQRPRLLLQPTDHSWSDKGATCLPLPWDQKVMESTAKSSLQGDAFNSFSSLQRCQGLGKDQVHSLEGCLITWTKQIKNILKQDPEALLNQRDHTHQGPMEELHFWAAKAKNLNSIFAQPQSDSIRIVLQYLDASKSTYNVPFAKLCKEVFLARAEANDNKHYLWPLAKWFEQLASAQTLPEIRDLFRPICHSILLIWKSKGDDALEWRETIDQGELEQAILRYQGVSLSGMFLGMKLIPEFHSFFAKCRRPPIRAAPAPRTTLQHPPKTTDVLVDLLWTSFTKWVIFIVKEPLKSENQGFHSTI